MENNNNSKRNVRTGGAGSHGIRMVKGEKAKNLKGTIKTLMGYLAKYKLTIILVIVFAIASTIFTIIGPLLLGNATTVLYEGAINIISNNGLGIDFEKIGYIIGVLIALYLASSLFSYLQSYLMVGVGMKLTYRLRKEIQDKINRLPLAYFDKKSYGEVLSYITNDIDVIAQNLGQGMTQIIVSFVTVIGILIMMLSISWQMTLVAVIILPLSLLIIGLVVGKSQRFFKGQQEYLGHVNGHIEEIYTNHIIVKAFNGEQKAINQFSEYNDKLYDSAWKAQFISSVMYPIMDFMGNIGYVVVCILGGYFASVGTITIGNIQSFIQYMRSFMQPIGQLSNVTNILQSTAAAAERVFEFLAEPEEIEQANKDIDLEKIQGNVEFKNVNFGYILDKPVINNFNATIQKGQRIAIVGPTGAGKTTIVKLLMRYYDVTSGGIIIDGVNIKDFKRNDLRSLFGMVLQDTWAFNGTIMENIRYGNLEATDEQVIKAAQDAQVDHFVRTLSEGYNTILNEESSNISQGQKQLLTIARAFLGNPKFLILDEATSSVDTRTETFIQKAMDNIMKGRTCFIIAHRLSTIKDADLILVMDKGDIVEQGTHQELLQKDGAYAKLYNSQFDEEE